jgi:hypothetical protein
MRDGQTSTAAPACLKRPCSYIRAAEYAIVGKLERDVLAIAVELQLMIVNGLCCLEMVHVRYQRHFSRFCKTSHWSNSTFARKGQIFDLGNTHVCIQSNRYLVAWQKRFIGLVATRLRTTGGADNAEDGVGIEVGELKESESKKKRR